MQQNLPCPWCSSTVQCGFCPRLGELLALLEGAIDREDADAVAFLESELAAMGVAPPANDNQPQS